MTIGIASLSFSQSNESVEVRQSTKQTINASENNSISELKTNEIQAKPVEATTSKVRNKYRIRRCCSVDHHGAHKGLISEYRKGRLNKSFIRMKKK